VKQVYSKFQNHHEYLSAIILLEKQYRLIDCGREMEKSPTSCKGKRQEWDGRFVHDGTSKQELPQPLRLRTMNGSAVKSTFEHLGTQMKKTPAQKLLTFSNSTASLRDKDKYHQECKKGGSFARLSQILPTHASLQCETAGHHFDATASSNLSLLTPTSDKSSEKEKSPRKNSYDSKYGEINDGLRDIIVDKISPFEGYSKGRVNSLKIDVSSSVQTIDIDDIEMRKELFDMANMDLSQSDVNVSKREDLYRGDLTRSGAINMLQPLCRLEVIGRGSSAIIYKAVLLKSLSLCAEKVIVVTDPSKRIQMMSELQTLKRTVRDRNGQNRCENIISLLDIVSNPREGTISICLEYLSGKYQKEHYCCFDHIYHLVVARFGENYDP
jgi:hypothetical protein